MALKIGTPNVDWAEWMKTYNDAVNANQAKYQSDFNRLMQGLGLTATEWERNNRNEEWNKYVQDNPNASFEDMYREHMKIYGGF